MQLDKSFGRSTHRTHYCKHKIPEHPDAVLTIIVNRVTGNAGLFYSRPVKNSLELYFNNTPYQRGEGQSQKTERAF